MDTKTALVIGASGMIGSDLLKQLLADERYGKVIALVRKPLGVEHEKLEQRRYDFDWPNPDLIEGDEFFCCLGTTIRNAGSQEAFKRVDYQYVLETAQAALKNGAKRMVIVSSVGANKDSKVFYTRVKGEIEDAVAALGFEACFILRPSMLLGVRDELRMGELVGKFAMTTFSRLIPKKYKAIEGKQVAKAMIQSINSEDTGKLVIESNELLEM
ncbi:MAG: NAD(P)H-binding protein [Aureispira sp.]|nr:NAD(P)H-binding protein [Aureispira sp.]